DVLAARRVDDPLLERARVPLGSVAEGREVAVVREDLPFDRERAYAGVAFVAERAVFPRRPARPGRRSRECRANHRCKCHQRSPHTAPISEIRPESILQLARPPCAPAVERHATECLEPCRPWACPTFLINFPE